MNTTKSDDGSLVSSEIESIARAWTPPYEQDFSREKTRGDWKTEEASAAAFDALAQRAVEAGVFSQVLVEKRGYYVQPRVGWKERFPKIDRILMPGTKLTGAEWIHGPIGVEIEKSGSKIAGPIEQLMDYSRAAWTVQEGYHCILEWFFVWPWDGGHGNVCSIAAQNRIGGVYTSNDANLIFKASEIIVLRILADGSFECRNMKVGNRTGHRSSKK